jgi:ABC-type proline/glycine betaine transport system substrate-binding protein
VALPGRGLTKVTVHTTQIEEKAQAIRALYELATALPSAWAPHLESTWQAIEPLLGYRYHADIRTTAAQSMSALVEAGFESRYDPVWTGFPRVAVAVARQLINEANTEPEDWYALADSLSEVMYSAFARKGDFQVILLQSYTGAVAEEVVQCCAQALQQCLQRRTAITTRMSSSSNPDELECCQQELKYEEKLLTPLVDSIGYSLKILGPSFVSIFEQKVAPLLGPYLRPNADARARLSAVCLFDDCVEHCGAQAAARFGPLLLPGVLTGMSAEDDDLKQASIYGIAQIARYSPHDVLAQDAASVIQVLASTASKPQEAAESEAIFENSVSALASLAIFIQAPFQGKYLKHEMGVQILLENLPLTTDFDEAKVCSTGLCDMVEAGAIPVATYTKPLVRVIGETLALVADDEEVATAAVCTRMAGILVRLQQEASAADLQDAFSTLTPESQTAIHTAVEQYSYLHNNVVTP